MSYIKDLLRRNAILTIIFWIGLGGCFAQTPSIPELSVCPEAEVTRILESLGNYEPIENEFVRLENGQFFLGESSFVAQGVNYYPSRYPWRRFLTETDTETLHQEFTLLRDTGFNTLRLFLWNEALFDCEGNGAVPNVDVFQRLDRVIQLSAQYGFRLIVTLNDLPDLDNYPLYDNPLHIQEQTKFIVARYVNEGTILAWDIRNEGDIDYGTHYAILAKSNKEKVINWLGVTAQNIRAIDTNHLLTAGWLYDAEATAPYVDFISFHHWTSANELLGRIETIRRATDKPILLEEFGYSTQRVSPEEQANLMLDIIATSKEQNLLGWLIWTAFDFSIDRSCYPSPCESPNNGEHYFGIWTTDYLPKPAYFAITNGG